MDRLVSADNRLCCYVRQGRDTVRHSVAYRRYLAFAQCQGQPHRTGSRRDFQHTLCDNLLLLCLLRRDDNLSRTNRTYGACRFYKLDKKSVCKGQGWGKGKSYPQGRGSLYVHTHRRCHRSFYFVLDFSTRQILFRVPFPSQRASSPYISHSAATVSSLSPMPQMI